MKKTYIIPQMKTIRINASQQLLQSSNPGLTGTYGGGTVLSRESSKNYDWDEE